MAQYNIVNNSLLTNNKSIYDVVFLANSTGGIVSTSGSSGTGNTFITNSNTNPVPVMLPANQIFTTGAAPTVNSVPVSPATDSLPFPVFSYGSGNSVIVTPTVNNSVAYANSNVIGGIMTFQGCLSPTTNVGMIESISLGFKGSVQSGEFDVAIFNTSPTGTFTDHNTAAIATTDTPYLLGLYQLTNPQSGLGTHTIYNLDGVAKQIVGASANLYVVVVAKYGTSGILPSTTDMVLRISTIW